MTGIVIRELRDLDEFTEAHRLFDEIWSFEPGADPVSVELMLSFAHFGNYVAGAFAAGRMVGASVGFHGPPDDRSLFSHITGAVQGFGAGTALKRHQRRWALERGVERIVWTFDPLVRRNAHFNLAKLGAEAAAYLPCFYGPMSDGINTGDDSDRLRTVWHLAGRPAADPADTAGAVPALVSRDGLPERRETSARTVLIETPPDIEALRAAHPAGAAAWRKEVRETLGSLMADGATVLGFHDHAHYVVRRT